MLEASERSKPFYIQGRDRSNSIELQHKSRGVLGQTSVTKYNGCNETIEHQDQNMRDKYEKSAGYSQARIRIVYRYKCVINGWTSRFISMSLVLPHVPTKKRALSAHASKRPHSNRYQTTHIHASLCSSPLYSLNIWDKSISPNYRHVGRFIDITQNLEEAKKRLASQDLRYRIMCPTCDEDLACIDCDLTGLLCMPSIRRTGQIQMSATLTSLHDSILWWSG